MRKVCFDTELTDQQAQTKLESVFNNEIEFEDVMFIKYSKSFELRTKQWDDPRFAWRSWALGANAKAPAPFSVTQSKELQ